MPTQIRFFHAYPPAKSFILADDGAVDVLLNDEMIAENIAFGEYTEYMAGVPGRGIISIYPTGKREQTLVQNRVIIPEENQYTLVLAERDGTPVLAPIQEREVSLAEGYSGIRFGHLVTDREPIRIVLTDRFEQSEPVYDNVEYGQITEYIIEQENPIAFDIYLQSGEERVLRVPWRQYRAGVPYTIFLLRGNGDDGIKVVTLEEDEK